VIDPQRRQRIIARALELRHATAQQQTTATWTHHQLQQATARNRTAVIAALHALRTAPAIAADRQITDWEAEP
jgi:Zn-dependent oligopeptidase